MISPVWDPDDLTPSAGDEGDEGGTSRSRRLTRRGRRRLFVVLLAGAIGFSVPVWVPRLLATLPAFYIADVHVVGTNYVQPEDIRRIVAVAPDASVWDDRGLWEERARTHPMVREATARRQGFHTLEITVVEKRPIALVATPELRPVSGDGYLLPLDPSSGPLDLPIVRGPVETDGNLVTDPEIRELIATLQRLDRTRREFMSLVSEITTAPEGGYRFLLLPGAEADIVLLPREAPLRALDRVSVALGQIEDHRVARADARFTGQVVLTRAEAR
ncbi:cell division protein FtsQ/DivIB [Candidatus Palauibacter sp.]|uniref:cell division protein FtsQ/DivIB n=1 Tax=Candidatus Palauibacter sp. TaxID=3101350 RepID=UPI003B5B19E5